MTGKGYGNRRACTARGGRGVVVRSQAPQTTYIDCFGEERQRRIKKSKGKDSTKGKKLQLAMRDGPECAYCGRSDLPLSEMTIDHIHPTCQGGTNRLWNLCLACAPCNGQKGGYTPIQWAEGHINRSGRARRWLRNNPRASLPMFEIMVRRVMGDPLGRLSIEAIWTVERKKKETP